VSADELLTAILELEDGRSSQNGKRQFVLALARSACCPFECQAATPNAIRVSVINDKVDPVSATTAPTVVHVPCAPKMNPVPGSGNRSSQTSMLTPVGSLNVLISPEGK